MPANLLPKPMTKKNREHLFFKRTPTKYAEATTFDRFVYGGLLTVAATAVSFLLVSLAFSGRLKVFAPKQPPVLTTFSEKLEFTSRYWVLCLFWIYFTTHVVILRRFMTKAINPLAGHEHLVKASININTNSIEQLVYSVVGQISLLSCLDSNKTVSIIPLLNVIWVFGRILYWLGYPKYRAFGMTLTVFPVSLALFFVVHSFFNYIDCRIYLI